MRALLAEVVVGMATRIRDAAPWEARVRCPICAAECDDSANFCVTCGHQLRGPSAPRLKWEFRDVEVPLGFVHKNRDESRRLVDRAVLEHLSAAGQEGWQTDEATDFDSLCAFGRIRTSQRFNWRRWRDELVCEAVGFRLKRLTLDGR